ncbi:MAG: hypothetical protein Tsb002_01510 [Wenzhouxiangellaceae bacterium]
MNCSIAARPSWRRLALILVMLLLAVNAVAQDIPPQGDPNTWACQDTLNVDLEQPITAFCAAEAAGAQSNPPKRPPEPEWIPQSLMNLDKKNEYDERFGAWIRDFKYRQWASDQTWRLTGPVVGSLNSDQKIADGAKAYGVHPAVRVYYSPKMVEWLCSDRQKTLQDGAIVIKEMLSINQPKVAVDDQSCMSIPDQSIDDSKIFWAIMVKEQAASLDGWYWYGNASGGNPPIVDRSAAIDPADIPASPQAPDPQWYPTTTFSPYTAVTNGQSYPVKPLAVSPYNLYGAYCLNCHASAISESTYSSLENVVSPGIEYHLYAPPQPHQAQETLSGAPHDAPLLTRSKQTGRAASQQRPPPFSTPRQSPSADFVKFYNQLKPVNFSEAWDLRLPAETFDHRVSDATGPGQFLTSDQCIGCHDATVSNAETPHMVFTDQQGNDINLSPYATWRTSPMGLAGRDPIFFSQLQSETNNLPQLAACIENTCLHCHGVMGQRQHAIDTQDYQGDNCREIFPVAPPEQVPFGKPFRLDMVTQYQNTADNPHGGDYGGLARDGISCAVCHHIDDDPSLGSEAGFTGNFVTGPADQVYGPYPNDTVVTKPMEHALGVTPRYGEQVTSSKMCGSCHNILLPVFTNEGKQLPGSYEQTTDLEWQNSDFAKAGDTFQSCQDCHMSTTFEGKSLSSYIANIEASNNFPPTTNRLPDDDIRLTKRDSFARHTLLGLNVFLNEMFQQFPVMLGLRQVDYMNGGTKPALTHTRDQFIEIAEQATAKIMVSPLRIDGNTITGDVVVKNLAGHYLPSGVGFRRVLLEYRLVDAQGNTLWCSGCTNDLGIVVDGATLTQAEPKPLPSELPIANPKAYQPHYQTITRQDQAQIYQELIKDSAGDFTTSFLRRVTHVKDNRLRPQGYDPAFYTRNFQSEYIHELATTYGEAANDPYYTNPQLTGADTITFSPQVDSATLKLVAGVEVRLYNQSIPPFYLQQRFRDANRGPAEKNEIQRLWYLTSHLNVDTQTEDGKAYIDQWKLGLACASRQRDGTMNSCQP